MGKKVFLSLLLGVFLFSCVGLVMASGKPNPRKGKYLYRKTCRACHKEGATGDMVGKPLSPIDKTQAEWKMAFEETEKLACQDRWGKLSQKELQDIFAYLHGHASDSPNPARCK